MNSDLTPLTEDLAELRKTFGDRLAELERQAELFEEHRQASLEFNEKLRLLKEEMDRDELAHHTRTSRVRARFTTAQEKKLLAALFDMVVENCQNDKGQLSSWGRPPYSNAFRLLAQAGLIQINDERGDTILATILSTKEKLDRIMSEE